MSKPAKKARADPAAVAKVDPVVEKVQETLEENLTFFMDNISGLIGRYDAFLGRAMACNRGTAAEIAAYAAQLAAATATAATDGAATGDAAAAAAAPTTAAAAADGAEPSATAPPARMPSSPLLKRAASPQMPVAAPAASSAFLSGTATTTAAIASPPTVTGADAQAPAPAAAPAVPAATGAATAAATSEEAASPKGGADKTKKKKKEPKVRIVEVNFPSNEDLLGNLRTLKRESYELATTMDGIHDWIALNVPDIKEDDNSGVEVMSAVIEQVSSLTDTVRGVYGLEQKYLEERSECEKRRLKYPESKMVELQLQTQDTDTWDDLDRGWRTLIRVCLVLYAVLAKNMTALKEPRKQRGGHSLFM
jgi:hypothetical protein